MRTFLLRVLVTWVVTYGLGVGAYALLHYPSGGAPGIGTVLKEFTADLASVFRRREPEVPVVAPALDLGRLRGNVALDLDLTLELSRVVVPGTSAHLQAGAAELWDALRPIHGKVLPEGIDELGRLRALKSSDAAAFDRDRAAARARLLAPRATLVRYAEASSPSEPAAKLLQVLDSLDARLAGL